MNDQLKKGLKELKTWIFPICTVLLLFLYYGSYTKKIQTLETLHRLEILAERKSAYLEGMAEGLEGFNMQRLEEVLNEQLEDSISTK